MGRVEVPVALRHGLLVAFSCWVQCCRQAPGVCCRRILCFTLSLLGRVTRLVNALLPLAYRQDFVLLGDLR